MRIRGVDIHKGAIGVEGQRRLMESLQSVAAAAPPFSPRTPRGGRMSVRMTSAGRVGWYADGRGYRYEARHPDGAAWPAIPEPVLSIWRTYGSDVRDPDCCLVNFYGKDARMGMHRDADEHDFSWPVVSVSLGDSALFRIGNLERGGSTESVWLESGDIVVMGGAARLVFHGIDRIRYGSSAISPGGGRVNVTLRVVGSGAG